MESLREEIMKQGKHKIDPSLLKMEQEFFRNYNEDMTPEEAKDRYAGMYGSDKDKVIPKKHLKKIWSTFITDERIDYITSNNTVSVEEIVSIGIDKFVRTNGWSRSSDVRNWRSNSVRVGKCPECNDQFLPMIMQANHGLCSHCRPKFSVKAIQRFVEHLISTSPRYYLAHRDALMDFYIMFYSDNAFRKLFLKDSETAKEYETREYVVPEWFKEEQQREMDGMQQRLLDMIPEESKDE